jgi:organic hydroperoxide reductase OsmC/OhrA
VGEPRAKIFTYEVEVAPDGATSIPAGEPLGLPDGWTPDHLLLAALVRCSIKSLAYHARHAGHEVRAGGTASGRVTRRESDDRYAFVEIRCRIQVELIPTAADTSELVAKAERDCFVGATLTLEPTYEWQFS